MTSEFKVRPFPVIIAFLFIINSCAPTLFLPALPQIAVFFHISPSHVKLAVPCFLGGVVISGLLVGNISDKIGKTNMMKILIPLYIVGTAISAFSTDIWLLLAGIIMQGCGAGSILALSQAVMADVFEDKKTLTKQISYISFGTTWVIAFGTVIGGYLTHHLSWRYTFIVLGLFALCIYPLIWCLPKTKLSAKSTSPIRNSLRLLTHKGYLRFVLCYSFAGAGLSVFYTLSPFLIIHDLHISAKDYGVLMFIPIAGLMLGRLISGLQSHRSNIFMTKIGLIFIFIGSIMMFWVGFSAFIQALIIMLSMAVYLIGLGIISPNARSGALTLMPAAVATAATLLSVLVNIMSSVHSFIMAKFFEEFLAEGLLVLSILSFCSFFIFDVYKNKKRDN
jgi:MFS transporter, DHA1 family, 2-module integral membrane pump EmrD